MLSARELHGGTDSSWPGRTGDGGRVEIAPSEDNLMSRSTLRVWGPVGSMSSSPDLRGLRCKHGSPGVRYTGCLRPALPTSSWAAGPVENADQFFTPQGSGHLLNT